MRPLGNRILVEDVDDRVAVSGGIVIPEASRETSNTSIVLALGKCNRSESGVETPFRVKVGDKVMLCRFGGTPVVRNGKQYRLVTEENIVAILN